jgi:hypothetical protein
MLRNAQNAQIAQKAKNAKSAKALLPDSLYKTGDE